jgi:uncharacterized membrane protein YvbJ
LDKNDECAKKEGKGKKKENAETRRKELCKKKESILLVGLLWIFVLVIVTDFTCRG